MSKEKLDTLIPFEMAEAPSVKEWEPPTDEVVDIPEIEENEENEVEAVEENDETTETGTEVQEDEQAVAAFTLFKELGVFSDEDIPEEQTLDSFKDTLSNFEEKVTERIIVSSPKEFQDVLEFALNRQGVTRKDLIEYLTETTVESYPTVDTPEDAESFLKQEWSTDKKFRNSAALQIYLDSLEDDEKVELAKEILADKDSQLQETRKQRIEAEKQQRLEAQKQQEEYISSLNSAIEETPWDKGKKAKVKEVYGKLQEFNQAIVTNPKTFAEYLNFLSTLDLKTGEFDTTKYVVRQASSKAKETKDSMLADKVTSALTKFTKGKVASNDKVDRLRPV